VAALALPTSRTRSKFTVNLLFPNGTVIGETANLPRQRSARWLSQRLLHAL
jgi:hypothetical protein